MQDLPDGTWLAHLRRTTPAAERNAEPMLVRVIDYTLDHGRVREGAGEAMTYRLFTTMLDPDQAPALDLAIAYVQRWEIENAFAVDTSGAALRRALEISTDVVKINLTEAQAAVGDGSLDARTPAPRSCSNRPGARNSWW